MTSNSQYDQNQDADNADQADFNGFFCCEIRSNLPNPRPNLELLQHDDDPITF